MDSDSRSNTGITAVVRELHQEFNRKLDGHLFIIQQQRNGIDNQQQQINYQRFLIDELSWQIRDLRDSLRKSDEKLHAVASQMAAIQGMENSSECEGMAETQDTDNVQSKGVRGSQCSDAESLYESINVGGPPVPTRSHPMQSRETYGTDQIDNVYQNDERDADDYLDSQIPRPPVSSPPHSECDTDTYPIQSNAETFEKLSKLYEMHHFVRYSNIELNYLDEVVYRYRERRDFSNRTKRGSSNSVWSLIPDREVEYMQHASTEGSQTNSVTSAEQKSMENQFLRQKSSEEVYI